VAQASPGPPSDELTETLAGLALFADLRRPELEAVAHTFQEEWINEGERVLRRGFGGSRFALIVEGAASVEVDGEEVNRLERGDFFGEVSVLLGERPSADVTAVTPLRCVTLSEAELREVLLDHPALCYRMLQAEARKLWKTTTWQS
jgi:CRP-like cAMP-binding protein